MIQGQILHPYTHIEEVIHHTLVEIEILMNIDWIHILSLFPAELRLAQVLMELHYTHSRKYPYQLNQYMNKSMIYSLTE